MLNELISRTRRNHALEHATIHMLSRRYKGFNAQGNSVHDGFFLNIYGNIPERAIQEAVAEAYDRLQGGEHGLAIHPNCGTVLLTTATMVTLASQMAFAVEQRRLRRIQANPLMLLGAFPAAILAGTVALIMSRPVGLTVQAHVTTDGDLRDLQVARVRKINPSPVTHLFRWLLAGGKDLEMTAYRVETVFNN